jgi:hypothetical protein
MGWLFTYGQRRAEVIASRLKPHEWDGEHGVRVRDTVLAHCFRGGAFKGTFYAVHERTTEKAGAENSERWIEVTLMACRTEPGYGPSWGYKDMEASMGPCEVSCPLGYLDMVPAPVCEAGCDACAKDRCSREWERAWRRRVREYHAARAAQRAKAAGFRVGDTIRLRAGCTPPSLTVVQVRPLRGEYGGRVYKVSAKHLA